MVTPPVGDGHMRASRVDRERVVDVLKAAFVQERLTQDELDARVGQALAARTYADLTALTADLPPVTAEPAPAAPAPAPARAQARRHQRPHQRAVKAGAVAIGSLIVVTSGTAAALGAPLAAVAIPIVIVIFAALTTAFVAAIIALALKAESHQQRRSRGQLPPSPGPGADGSPSPGPVSPGPRPTGRARPRRPRGSLAVRPAGSGSPALSKGAIPRGGRTDRGLAAGHGRTQPAGLVLAGHAGYVRRGRSRPGLGHRRARHVLRGGLPDHRRAALA
jgi:hypothetical protein